MVTLENMPTAETLKLKEALEGIEGVDQVIWTSDLVDVSVPKEIASGGTYKKFFYNEDGATMLLVKFTDSSASASTMNALAQMKATVQEHCFIGGMSAIMADTKQLVNSEMPLYILCAVGFSLLILFLSMKSTLVPLLFIVGIFFPIVYNFGTNIFLGQISYITQALATVRSLASRWILAFSYCTAMKKKKQSCPNEEAMVRAICSTFTSITASSLTTIAGFLAMCTMSLTLWQGYWHCYGQGCIF